MKKRAITDAKKQERKNDILDCTLKLFLKKSFETISMAEIAQSCHLAKGTLYLYFPSKEELFLALKQRAYESWFTKIDEALALYPKHPDLRRSIDWFARKVTKTFTSRNDLRLVSSLHHVLERNISEQTILNFNLDMAKHIQELGKRLETILPFVKTGNGSQLLLLIKALAIGLDHVAEPIPASLKGAVQKNALKIMEIDFSKVFYQTLQRLISL